MVDDAGIHVHLTSPLPPALQDRQKSVPRSGAKKRLRL
jgi:hypothetical protein